MERIIKADLYRYGGLTGWKGFLKAIIKHPGFRYTYILRKAAKTSTYSLPGIFWRLLLRKYSFKYGFQIHPSTQIGEGFFIGHFGLVGINPDVVIGKNCNLAHNVSIAQTNRGKLKGKPTIGDYVWIGAGAVLVGKIKIGNNVLIAPNAFVNFDVPDNSIVIGNPGVIRPNERATERYIMFVIDEQ
jgi:serine O-acetyltransferase